MRFIWMHKADRDTEAGISPGRELIADMGKLMDEMSRAGVLLAGEGLQPSSRSVRLKFSSGLRTVTRGPLSGSTELLQGFSVVRMKSMEEAVECASRFGTSVPDAEVDIGQVKEPWDLGLCARPADDLPRLMIMHKADKDSEAGALSPAMSRIAELSGEMARVGTLLSSVRLQPSSKGVRLRFSSRQSRVIDGPFTESKELIGGYCIVQVETRENAIARAIRFARLLARSRSGGEVELDILPLYEDAGSA